MKQITWLILGLFLCGIVLSARPVQAIPYVYNNGAWQDTYVDSSHPDWNMCMNVGYRFGNDSGTLYSAYFQFPQIPTPPVGAEFVSAQIVLTYYIADIAFSADVYHLPTDSWMESDITWNEQPFQGGGWELIASPTIEVTTGFVPRTLSIDATTLVQSDTGQISICLNCTDINAAGYVEGATSNSDTMKPVLVVNYSAEAPNGGPGIAGYDVAFLALTTIGIVVLLSYKYRHNSLRSGINA